jgi:hypothetical protein
MTRNPKQLPAIDFSRIRTHQGTQHGGFEELTVSLFRHEQAGNCSIHRINGAGGDGGVEVYAKSNNRNVVALQAKYFQKIGPPQFRQIEKSIFAAAKNFPELSVYIVAAPIDLSPAQDRKWDILKGKATKLCPGLNLVWWGESELLHLLTQPVHAGRVSYWFGARTFDFDWLKNHNEQALSDLDTRYSPKDHVDVSVQLALSAFSEAPEFIQTYYNKARQVWIAWRAAVDIYQPENLSMNLVNAIAQSKAVAAKELPRLGDGISLPNWSVVPKALEELALANETIMTELKHLADQTRTEQEKLGSPDEKHASGQRISSLKYKREKVEKSLRRISSLRTFIEEQAAMARQNLIVKGEAGSGKSHLLADFVQKLTDRGQCALLLLGEYFTDASEPWGQLVQRLGWHDTSDDLLASLNYAGEVSGMPSILVIDALNESSHRQVWLNHLAGFANRIRTWPWVRLAISCRSDFLQLTLPSRITSGTDPNWSVLEHRGFAEATFKAVTRYFQSYCVIARDFPPLLPEFENPLFLRTFSEAFANSEIPSGPLSLDRVMQRRVDVACTLIERAIDCPADCTKAALEWLAGQIESNNWQAISQTEARRGIDGLFQSIGQSRSLYHHLKSSGLVTEVGNYGNETIPEIRVRFAYERFSDYFIAKRLIRGINSAKTLKASWKRLTKNSAWDTYPGYYKNRGLLRALGILLPERFGIELPSLLRSKEILRPVLDDFLQSLPWRSAESVTEQSRAILNDAQNVVPLSEILTTLLRLSSIPGHPWNSDHLHNVLKAMSLSERDKLWTITISKTLGYGESVPEFLIRWMFEVSTEPISDELARLIAQVLAWLFTSNDRGLRTKATLAAIKLLQGRAPLVAQLVEDFHDVNDPYVVERVLAVAAGVAIREHDGTKLAPLAEVVWKRIFEPPIVLPHILTRNYAHTVMENAFARSALPVGVQPSDYKPPYRSHWPKIWSEKRCRALDNKDGWNSIIHSIEPEYGRGIGGYGDFGRYVMQAHVHQWTNVRRNSSYSHEGKNREFDPNIARRWILQRVADLGWTPDRFDNYDKQLSHGRLRVDIEKFKQERIGKKYQWIALHELEALLSDHFHLSREWRNEDQVFEGAWQLYSPDFDPAQPMISPIQETEDEEEDYQRTGRKTPAVDWWVNYPDPFADKLLLRDRSAWVRTMPEDPGQLLRLDKPVAMSGDALVLAFWQVWDEPDSYPPREHHDGIPHMFMHARAWIVPSKQRAKWLKILRETHFWGDGCSLPELRISYLGEYPWATRFERFRRACESQDRFGRDYPPGLSYAACTYANNACVPSPQAMEILGAKWSGKDFDFINNEGQVVAISPRPKDSSRSAPCLVCRDTLLKGLKENEMTLLWGVVGERLCFDYEGVGQHVADSHITFSAVHWLDDNGQIQGGITQREIVEIPDDKAAHQGPYRSKLEKISQKPGSSG